MKSDTKNVLFLCADNCSRSLFAESILRKDGAGRFRAYSAGSLPGSAIHPLALDILESFSYPTEDLRPKDWFLFDGDAGGHMDFVLTVCDQAAPSRCPCWSGQPEAARWPIPDPARQGGSEVDLAAAFVKTFYEIRGHLNLFLALPFDRLDRFSLQNSLVEIHGRAKAG